jgi:hypothetical protein
MKIPSAASATVITLAAFAAAAMTVSIAGPVNSSSVSAAPVSPAPDGAISHGRYLVAITGCPSNLRLTVQSLTEPQWLVFARAQRLPPMPWMSLKQMSDRDLADIYWYIRSLGQSGEAAPAAVPPGGKVNTPFIVFQPQNLGPPTVSQAGSAGSGPRS